MKKIFKTPGKIGTTSNRLIRFLLLLLMTWGSVTTYAQTIGVLQGLTPVSPRPGKPDPITGNIGSELPCVTTFNSPLYINRFYKFNSNGDLEELTAVSIDTSFHDYYPYCTCPVSSLPPIYRAVTINCYQGSVGPWKPDLYSDPALSVATNNCTASEAWSNPLTWYDYKVPNPATGGFYLNRNVTLDVNYDATNKSIQSLNGSALTINNGITFTSVNTNAGRFINNGIMNGIGQHVNVVNNGVLAPGVNGIGQFSVRYGKYTQNTTGSLNIQLESANSYDKLYLLQTTDDNVLGGTLKVTLLNGFVPVVNNSFTIVDMAYATYTGTFSNLVLPALSAGLKWKIRYNPNTVTLTVVDCSQFSGTYAKSDTGCFGSTIGSILATPVNGTAPYMYKLNSGTYGTTNPFNNLKAGNYKVSIMDDNGCTTVSPIIAISQYPAVTCTAVASALCHDSTGSITVTPVVGTAPFLYKIGTKGTFGTSNTFSSLKAGITYTVTIMDAHGCTGLAKASFVNPPAITTTATPTTVSPCSYSTNGSITINPTNGVSPYVYKLNATGTYGSSNTFSGLKGATSYKVYTKDANGCAKIDTVVLNPPPAVVVSYTPVDPTCTNATGSITLGALQSPNATFKLNPGSSGYTSKYIYSGLAAGNYVGYAKNTSGCIGRTPAIVLSPATGCRSSITEGKIQTTNEGASNGLTINLSPNPSSNVFKLITHTAKIEAIQLRVIDIYGKVVYTAKGSPTQSFTFGEAFANGVYLLEVRQGNDVKNVKAVKSR